MEIRCTSGCCRDELTGGAIGRDCGDAVTVALEMVGSESDDEDDVEAVVAISDS